MSAKLRVTREGQPSHSLSLSEPPPRAGRRVWGGRGSLVLSGPLSWDELTPMFRADRAEFKLHQEAAAQRCERDRKQRSVFPFTSKSISDHFLNIWSIDARLRFPHDCVRCRCFHTETCIRLKVKTPGKRQEMKWHMWNAEWQWSCHSHQADGVSHMSGKCQPIKSG